MACLLGHKWDGCICLKCSKTRDVGHDWDLCKGKCRRCGKKCTVKHNWNYCTCTIYGEKRGPLSHCWESNDQCTEKCSICGETREAHKLSGCVCTVCGKKMDEDFYHKWNKCVCTVCGKIRSTLEHKHGPFVSSHNCRKTCSICNTVFYDHDYEQDPDKKSDGRYRFYLCRKCGQEAYTAPDTYGGEIGNYQSGIVDNIEP